MIFDREEMAHTNVVNLPHYLNCVRTLPEKILHYTFDVVHKKLECTFECNSFKSWSIWKFCARSETGNKFYRLRMHLFTYYVNSVSLMTSQKCHRSLTTFAVNHVTDEWRRPLSACVEAEGGHFQHCLWLLLLKWPCHNGSTVKLSLAVIFLFYFALNINSKKL